MTNTFSRPCRTLIACLLMALSSAAQISARTTTVCVIIDKDSLFAGTTDRSSFYAVQGFNFAYEGPLNADVITHIGRQAARCKSFGTLTDSCKADIRRLFLDYFTEYIKKDSADFNRNVMGGRLDRTRTIGHICLFGFENDKPALIDILFYINKGVKHPVVISYSGQPQPSVWFYTGPIPGIKGPIGNFSGAGGMVEVKRTISYLKTGKITGGPPVDIEVMTKNKTEWYSK